MGKMKNFFKSNSFKHGGLGVVVTAVFVACIILINVLVSALAERYPLNLDFTSQKDYTISADNLEHIKKIDKDVTITVSVSEALYTSTEFVSVMSESGITDSTGGRYFKQAVEILKNYAKVNPKIKLQFIDATTPGFEEFKNKYPTETIYYGDYIVECSFKNQKGETINRHKVLSFDTLFAQQDVESSYTGGTQITGSNVESAVTSSLYFVTSEQTDYVRVFTGYGCTDVTAFTNILKSNNYEIDTIDNLAAMQKIPDETNLLILAAPTVDFTSSEIKILEDYLYKEGLKKNLIYFASSDQKKLPNLESALREWGIEFEQGTVIETDQSKMFGNDSQAIVLNKNSDDYIKDYGSYVYFGSGKTRPMNLAFTESGKYRAVSILNTNPTTVIRPVGEASNWSPSSKTDKKSYEAMVLSAYGEYADPNDKASLVSSSVLAIAGIDFISDGYMNLQYIANSDALLRMASLMVDRNESAYAFNPKVINQATFSVVGSQLMNAQIICLGVIPVGLIAVGVIIFIRRKRR